MSEKNSKEKLGGDFTQMDGKAQRKTILQALGFLHPKGQVFELCVIGAHKEIAAGWFSDHEKAADWALKSNKRRPEGIYVTVNPCREELLNRADHQLKVVKTRTKDDDIPSIKNIFIDVDAVRPSGVSATEAELKAALKVAKKIRRDLRKQGFPEPLLAMSGNGGHLIYKASLKNNGENRDQFKRFLVALGQEYDNDQAIIDQAVANPSRLVKLYGTMARKGKEKSDRQHRYATIIEGVDAPKAVRLTQLQKFAPKPTEPTENKPAAKSESGFLDVHRYIEHYGKKILDEKAHEKATLFVLEKCIFNSDHGKKEAAIGQCEDGTLFYQCFHNSCKYNTWHEARKKISGVHNLSEFYQPTNEVSPRETTNIQQTYTIITARDLVNMDIKESPIINGLMMDTENLLIVGESGIGKSVLTLNLAFNLGLPGKNKSLWDFSTIPHTFKTLFIQSENSKAGTKSRIELMQTGKPQFSKALRNLCFPWVKKDCRISGDLLDPDFQRFVKEFTLTTGSKVLVFDPLISFHQADENNNTEMRRVLNALSRICIETETSPIVVHHTGKSEASWSAGGRGASSIGDWADNIIRISHAKPKDPQQLLITHQKSRNFRVMPPFVLELTGTLDFTKVRTNRRDASEDLVRKALEALGGKAKTQDALAEKVAALGGFSTSTANRLIPKAVKAGTIEKVRHAKAVGYQFHQD